MSRGAKILLLLVLVVSAAFTAALHWGRGYLLERIQHEIALKVEAEALSFTWTRQGPALRLRQVQLIDPTTGERETAPAVDLVLSLGRRALNIHVNGLSTSYFEDAQGRFYSPVWDALITRVSEPGASALKSFDLRFDSSRLTVRMQSGYELEARPLAIYGGGTNPTRIEARLGEDRVDCTVPTEAGKLVECSAPRLSAVSGREFLSVSRLLPDRLRRNFRKSGLNGGLRDVRFVLWENGDFSLDTHLERVTWSPRYFPLPPMDGIEARFHIEQFGTLTQAEAKGVWNESPFTLELKGQGPRTEGEAHIEAQASGFKRAYPDFPLVSRLSGQTPVLVRFADDTRALKWTVTSDLRGIKMDLPVPLHKNTSEAGALKFNAAGAELQVGQTHVIYERRDDSIAMMAPAADLAEWQSVLKQDPSRVQPGGMPEFDFDIAAVSFKGKALGRLVLKTARQLDGFSVEKLRLDSDHQHFVITKADWTSELPHTRVQGWFETTNIGDTLEMLDMPKKVEGSPFRIGFDLNWPGTPWEVKTENLNGHLSGEMAKGQLNATSPILRRILSLAAIDLGNVINGRLDFDRGRGRMEIENGRLRTSSRLSMTLARFQFAGEADLTDGSLDGGLRVTPMLSGSLLNSALTVLVPAAGITVWALEADEDSMFNRMKTTKYKVGNSLRDPSFHFMGW